MLDPTLNLNINKPKSIIDFSNKLAKYEGNTMEHRKKILKCKKCGQIILSRLEEKIKNIDDTIVKYDKYLIKQMNDPFKHVIEDPRLLIANLQNQRYDVYNCLQNVDLSDVCWKCRYHQKQMVKNYRKYKNLKMVLEKLNKKQS